MLEFDLCLGFVAACALAGLARAVGLFPFASSGSERRGAFVALALCALLTASALQGALELRAKNRAAGHFLPMPAHPRGWHYELPWTNEYTAAGPVRIPNLAGVRRNALHDAVRAFGPWLALLPAVALWTTALLVHPRVPGIVRPGAAAVFGALVNVHALIGPLNLSDALSGD